MISKVKSDRIKKAIVLLAVLIVPVLSFGNDRLRELFNRGNDAYDKGNYKEALSTYRKITEDGYESAAVWYNIGNVYYKLNDIPDAVLYYEKARKISPGDDDINFNLQLAAQKTSDKIEAAPEFFITRWWKSSILFFSLHTLAVLSILFLIVGFICLSLYLFAPTVRSKKASFYSGVIIILVGLLTVFTAAQQNKYFSSHRMAIIFTGAVTVKSGPSGSAKDLFVLHEGTRVIIGEKEDNWVKIELANGNIGWIHESDIREI